MIAGLNGESLTEYFRKLDYIHYKMIVPEAYNSDIRHDCEAGVHFFMNREDAEAFSF